MSLECGLKKIRDKLFNPNDTRSGRLSSLPNLDGGHPAETLQDPIGSAERVSHDQSHDLAVKVKTEVQDVDEIVLNNHATTGSETESDVETTVRPKVSYRDIEAPEGTVFCTSTASGRLCICEDLKPNCLPLRSKD